MYVQCNRETCVPAYIHYNTCLHLLKSPASTLRASITMRPAITALVVAMAGIILPAMAVGTHPAGIVYTHTILTFYRYIHFISNLLFFWMPNTWALRLAAAATKSIDTLSSCKQVNTSQWAKTNTIDRKTLEPYPTPTLLSACILHSTGIDCRYSTPLLTVHALHTHMQC